MASSDVKIVIDISAKDSTAAAVKQASKGLTELEKLISKIEEGLGGLKNGTIDLTANDQASPILRSVSDALNSMSGNSAVVDVTADDSATGILTEAGDTLGALNGDSATVDVMANDAATGVITEVEDEVARTDGNSATVDLDADDNATPAIKGVEDALNALNGQSATVDINANGNASEMLSELSDAQSLARGAASQGQSRITGLVGSAAGIMGAGFGVSDSVSVFGGFESTMSSVRAISGATAEQMDRLTAKAKEMGATTKFTAQESAQAFTYMAMAGWKPEQMLSSIEGVMNLAAASGEDLGRVSDIVTDSMTAFGMSAEESGHFADVLAQAASNSNTNIGMMGESFKYIAPLAGSMGYSIEDTSLALGLMANAGIKSSMAGTSLRRAMNALLNPTEEEALAMEQYGISLTDQEGNMKSLNEIMGDLRTNLGGLSRDEKSSAVATMFGATALSGMLAIVNSSESDFEKLSQAVNNADGASENMAKVMMDNMVGAFTLMQSAMEGVESTLGGRLAPYFTQLANSITEMMPAATEAISSFFDSFDTKISSMTSSDAWANADLFGKIDIAWDTLIADPFMEWVGGEGASLISDGVGKLFSEAFKILPGGEEAGLTSWLSAGILVEAGTRLADLAGKVTSLASAVSGLGAAGTTFGAFTSALGGVIPIAAGVAAGLLALNLAIDAYNSKTITNNIAEHFGEIQLTSEQIQSTAKNILDMDYSVNVHTILNEIKGAEEMRSDAEEALRANNKLMWLAQVQTQMEKDGEDPVPSFAKSIQGLLTSRETDSGLTYKPQVATELGNPEAGTSALAEALVGMANSAIGQADGKGLDTYTATVASELGLDNESGVLDNITNLINGAIQGASPDDLDTYTNTVMAELTPEQQGDFLSALGTMVSGLTKTQLAEDLRTTKQKIIAKLTPDQAADYKSNIETFIKSKISELEQTTYPAKISVQTFLGGSKEGQTLAQNIEEWAGSDQMELSGLSESLTEAVNNALMDGIMEVDEQAVISELQSKMDAITGRWQQASKMANMDWIANEYGSLSGKDLEAGSFSALIGELENQRSMGAAETQSAAEALFTTLNSAQLAGRITADQNATYHSLASQAIRNQEATNLMTSMDFMGNTLRDAYSEQVGISTGQMSQTIQDEMSMLSQYAQWANAGDSSAMADFAASLNSGLATPGNGLGLFGTVTNADQAGLNSMWELMKPTADQYSGLIDEYVKAGQEIPSKLMESFNSAMELGAASGDADAAMQMYANAIAQSGDEAIISAVENMQLEGRLDEGFSKAWDRATASVTDEPLDLKGLQADITDMSVDSSNASEAISEAVSGITAEGETVDVEAGADVTINPDNVDADTSGIEAALEEKLSGENGEAETEASVDVTTTAGEVDASQAVADAESKVDEAFSTPFEPDGEANVKLTQTNNASQIYTDVDDEIDTTFGGGFDTTATVTVTLNWVIANPTASIDVSTSGGTATATISGAAANAEGGLVSSPLLSWVGEDGPEMIIPLGADRRDRGMSLWEQAGEILGVGRNADGGLYSPNAAIPAGGSSGGGMNAPVNVQVSANPVINVNGSSGNSEDIVAAIRRSMSGMVDELAGDMANRLKQVYSNMTT